MAYPPHRIDELRKSIFDFAQSRSFKNFDDFDTAIKKEPLSRWNVWGGNTTCVEFISDLAPMPIFFDAGTGLTQAGMDPNGSLTTPAFKRGNGKVAIFLSHTHWDHLLGLLTVEQFFKGNEVHFYGVHKNLNDRIQTLFDEKHFPVPFHVLEPHFKFHQIPLNTPMQFGGLNVHHYPQSHPGGSFAYRVTDGKKVFVFATDTELKNVDPPHLVPGNNLYTNADFMILDAQFSPEDFPSRIGYGHAEIMMCVDFAVREKTKVLALFHQSPYYSDEQIDQQLKRAREYLGEKYPSSKLVIMMAHEGQEITL